MSSPLAGGGVAAALDPLEVAPAAAVEEQAAVEEAVATSPKVALAVALVLVATPVG